ncbi:hypothetical protein [Streptomyces sp. NPDC059918]|uniref:hypothetical protein n=1 Tax=unclassified Streptomyces TaxID=2593676 RepID=UPI003664A1AE
MNSRWTTRRISRSVLASGIAVAACVTGTALTLPQASAAVRATTTNTADNLLKDGGFDQADFSGDRSNVPQEQTGWKTQNPKGLIETWRLAYGLKPHSDRQNVELDKTQKDVLYQDVQVTPGTRLQVSMWYKARYEGDLTKHTDIALTPQHGTEATLVPLTKTGETSGEWTRFSGVHTVPAGVTQLRLELRPTSEGQLVDSVVLAPEPTLRTEAATPSWTDRLAYTSTVEAQAGGSFTDGVLSIAPPKGTKLADRTVRIGDKKVEGTFDEHGRLSVPLGGLAGGSGISAAYELLIDPLAAGPFEIRPSLDYKVKNLGKVHVDGAPLKRDDPRTADLSVTGEPAGTDGYKVTVVNKGRHTGHALKLTATDADGKEVPVLKAVDGEGNEVPDPKSSLSSLDPDGDWKLEIPTTSPTLKVTATSAVPDPDAANNTVILHRDGSGDGPGDGPVDPAKEADLAVKLTADTDKPVPGGKLTLDVEVVNNGAAAARGNRVKAVLPSGFKPKLPENAVANELPEDKGVEYTWLVADLAAKASYKVALTGEVPTGLAELRADVRAGTETPESELADNAAELGLKIDQGADGDSGDGGSLALTGAGGVAVMGAGGAAAIAAGAWAMVALRRRRVTPGDQ